MKHFIVCFLREPLVHLTEAVSLDTGGLANIAGDGDWHDFVYARVNALVLARRQFHQLFVVRYSHIVARCDHDL